MDWKNLAVNASRVLLPLNPVQLIHDGKAVSNYIKNNGNTQSQVDTSQSSLIPLGDTYRGIGSSWFNAGNIADEDFMRQVQYQDYTNQFNASEAEKNRQWQTEMINLNNQFNASEAEKNRQWQTEMSNSAITRAVADMKNAGINPILAYSTSASTPSGGVASGSTSGGATASAGGTIGNRQTTDPLTNLISTVISVGAGLLTSKWNVSAILNKK